YPEGRLRRERHSQLHYYRRFGHHVPTRDALRDGSAITGPLRPLAIRDESFPHLLRSVDCDPVMTRSLREGGAFSLAQPSHLELPAWSRPCQWLSIHRPKGTSAWRKAVTSG